MQADTNHFGEIERGSYFKTACRKSFMINFISNPSLSIPSISCNLMNNTTLPKSPPCILLILSNNLKFKVTLSLLPSQFANLNGICYSI